MKSAGSIEPSPKRWRVVETHDHKTLRLGDVVIMAEIPLPDLSNILIREADMTLHWLRGDYEQYVHLEEI